MHVKKVKTIQGIQRDTEDNLHLKSYVEANIHKRQ